jgi:alpha-galactosidase/6-phospho-beta-glucosidase family protein
MNNSNDKVSNLKIAYIGGGSRNWARKLMCDLALEPQLSGLVSLFDIDQEAAGHNVTIGNAISGRSEAAGTWRYEAVATIEQALTGADFVILSILPGTFEEMAVDVHAPEKYGIYQSVGDTVGPGGIIRALRTIPLFVDFARQIERYCPSAWVINYTNPMTLCTRTLYDTFPGIKAFGCCHEVFSAQEELSAILEVFGGVSGVERFEIETNVKGINHFTWIDRASYKGIDLMELYRIAADQFASEGYRATKEGRAPRQYGDWRWPKPLHFELFDRYGLIPAAGARHMVEFMPHEWYMSQTDADTLKNKWGFELTTVRSRIEYQDKQIEETKRIVAGDETVELKPSKEEGVRILKGLLGLETFVTNINVPNRGQLVGIPEGAVVESNALIQLGRITPLQAGELPLDLLSLVALHVYNQELVLKAGIRQDYSLGYKAFVKDPLVYMDLNKSKALYDEMLEGTCRYLNAR